MPRRDWTAPRAKVDREVICRACGRGWGPIDAAHLIPRSRVASGPGQDEHNIVPLCRDCHSTFDAGALDLRPFLSADEVAYAVELVGAAEAERRLMGSRAWRVSSRPVGEAVNPPDGTLAKRLGDYEQAWIVIANAYGGNWEEAPAEWREAAERWRDEVWHSSLDVVGAVPDAEARAEKWHSAWLKQADRAERAEGVAEELAAALAELLDAVQGPGDRYVREQTASGRSGRHKAAFAAARDALARFRAGGGDE